MTFVRVCAKFDYLTLVTSATYGGNPEQIIFSGAFGRWSSRIVYNATTNHEAHGKGCICIFLDFFYRVFYLPISCFKRTLVLIYYHFLHIQHV